ncbi:hypothetical protein GHR37_04415 [Achromobacter xylosoxidans]|nr:hypothetical protein [Achromobacter xylosoxidans]
MASIGKLHIGATADEHGLAHPSAIVCPLLAPFKQDVAWQNVNGDWFVTAKAGLSYICARSPSLLSLDVIKREGMVALTQALDLFSVQMNQTSNLSKPGDTFFALYRQNDRQALLFNATFDMSVSMDVSVRISDKDGSERPEPERPRPIWNRAFRYYRLSQLAADVYEAYRNLYLAFEALVAAHTPRGNNEREGAWIRRCFQEIHARHDLKDLAPEGHRHPNEYLFGILYESTRCNLFHAQKVGSILPYYEVAAPKIHEAYRLLLSLWRRVADATLQTSSGGGVVTYAGYRLWMDRVLGEKPLAIGVSDDVSPVQGTDTQVGGPEFQLATLQSCQYQGEASPGIVRVEASESQPKTLPRIYRLGLLVDGTLHMVSGIREGLSLTGIDSFHVVFDQRLIQGNQPKALF